MAGFVYANARDVSLDVRWAEKTTVVSANWFGHNAVWSRGGLGLWDDRARAPVAAALARVKELSPPTLRFPGGTRAMRYHFDEAIGPVARRRAQCDPFTGQMDATNYGLDEFLGLAKDLGAAVTLVSAWVDGSAPETAALVAYVNGDVEKLRAHPVLLGKDGNGKDWGTALDWARKRGEFGHPEPYGVEFLEIGNEPYLDVGVGPEISCGRSSQFKQSERWVNGRAIATTAVDHARQVALTGALVKKINPAILVGASALATFDGTSDTATLVADVDDDAGSSDGWNKKLVEIAAPNFDFFVLHPYDFGRFLRRSEVPSNVGKVVEDLKRLAPDKRVAISEFGVLAGGGTFGDAVFTADVLLGTSVWRPLFNLRHILIEDLPEGPFAQSASILGPDFARTAPFYVMKWATRAFANAALVPARTDAALSVAVGVRPGGWGAILVNEPATGEGETLSVEITPPSDGPLRGTLGTLTAPGFRSSSAETRIRETVLANEKRIRVTLPAHAIAVVSFGD